MKQVNFIASFIFLCCSFQLTAQNVGVGTTAPASRLTVVGDAGNPTIPGTTSTGVLRVEVGTNNNEGIDIGKSQTFPFSGWVQSGFNGIAADPLSLQPLGGSVGIGVLAPHASAALDVTSTTQGLLPPRLTLAQRNAIATPAEGLMISCTDCTVKGLHQYINGVWQAMTSGNTGNYGTVVNPVTGKVWLDRNLGATQVAISSTDLFSYGNLFQWGRGADGHQVRTSGNIPTQATDWLAGSGAWNGSFITVFTNWLSTGETHMWSGTAAENNPCPSGFRLPTNAEWEQERLTWSPSNSYGAFASPLKLPMAGYRLSSNGGFSYVGNVGSYWSSTANGSNANALYFTDGYTSTGYGLRGTGSSVRCIKD
ncbi:MAG: hypothetical protein IPN86_13840 [Saprospiraceae bacterium]|nr:hypothetical protein [Saprospiraceae bacterium]